MQKEEFFDLVDCNSVVGSDSLDTVIKDYPYFQLAKAVKLRLLKQENSTSYNSFLKEVSAVTVDRSVLFYYISGFENVEVAEKETDIPQGSAVEDTIVDDSIIETKKAVGAWREVKIKKASLPEEVDVEKVNLVDDTTGVFSKETKIELEEIQRDIKGNIQEEIVVDELKNVVSEEVFIEEDFKTDAIKESIRISKLLTEQVRSVSENLNIGSPISFSKDDEHSFNEWLSVSTEELQTNEEESVLGGVEVKKSNISSRLIENFIKNKPRIKPVKKEAKPTKVFRVPESNTEELMTETLAKVYLEQKKYDSSIKAYEILSLKYPKKSVFFADCIEKIKQLKIENR
ncbi:MAG: hypothetical protein HRT66_12330 [Flavobacteriaceae bacterium]|nr:hypothetical protein [Flavobacteriaceae bacterium]